MATLLELKNVETYYGPVMAIRGVSLQVRKGQIVALLGANGAGKTTVLKTISGAMEPQKGSITLDDTENPGPRSGYGGTHGGGSRAGGP